MFTAHDLDEFVRRSECKQSHRNHHDRACEPDGVNKQTHASEHEDNVLSFLSLEKHTVADEKSAEHADHIDDDVRETHVGDGLEEVSYEIHTSKIKM